MISVEPYFLLLATQRLNSNLLFPNAYGVQAILSRDDTRRFEGRSSRRTRRSLLDHGLRHCGKAHPLGAPILEDIPEVQLFIEQVRVMADRGPYSLFTDGSHDNIRTPEQRLFHVDGAFKAAAALVAIPSSGDFCGVLPALYMSDVHSAMDSAFPLEYLALVLAKYVASQVQSCKQICSDCRSAIDKHGLLPCISRFAPLDQIWPALATTPLRDLLPLNEDGSDPTVTHIHSHADKKLKRKFDQLSFEAKGNCVADRAAGGGDSLHNIRLVLTTVPVETLLSCATGLSANWMRLRNAGEDRLCQNLHYQETLHRTKRIEDYWMSRTLSSDSDYIWVHGHSRLAAAAGLVGSKAIAGKVGTIKLIHDKYWWGNKHNPARTYCEHCAALLPFAPADAEPDTIKAWEKLWLAARTGMGHWGAVCIDPRVVNIRLESEQDARKIIQERLGDSSPMKEAFQCANFLLGCMLEQPYRFQGRFDEASAKVMGSEINKRSSHIGRIVKTMVRCVRVFLEAGKDIYSLRTPGQMLARQRQKAAYKATIAEQTKKSNETWKLKDAAKYKLDELE